MTKLLTLTSLPGVRRKLVKARWVRSASSAIRNLNKYRAVTAAGDNGAINVWIDDAKAIHAERMRFMCTKAQGVFKTKAECGRWLKAEFPEIE